MRRDGTQQNREEKEHTPYYKITALFHRKPPFTILISLMFFSVKKPSFKSELNSILSFSKLITEVKKSGARIQNARGNA
jgi:hypothetical protein